jgi:hypothetical protein
MSCAHFRRAKFMRQCGKDRRAARILMRAARPWSPGERACLGSPHDPECGQADRARLVAFRDVQRSVSSVNFAGFRPRMLRRPHTHRTRSRRAARCHRHRRSGPPPRCPGSVPRWSPGDSVVFVVRWLTRTNPKPCPARSSSSVRPRAPARPVSCGRCSQPIPVCACPSRTPPVRCGREKPTDATTISYHEGHLRRDACACGDFLESAEVHGNFYGTSRAWIAERMNCR